MLLALQLSTTCIYSTWHFSLFDLKCFLFSEYITLSFYCLKTWCLDCKWQNRSNAIKTLTSSFCIATMWSRAASTCALCPVITITSLSLPSDGNSILVSVSSRICNKNSTQHSVIENMGSINTNTVCMKSKAKLEPRFITDKRRPTLPLDYKTNKGKSRPTGQNQRQPGTTSNISFLIKKT